MTHDPVIGGLVALALLFVNLCAAALYIVSLLYVTRDLGTPGER